MIKIYYNLYRAENFFEQTAAKKCCKASVIYLIKCENCQDIICTYHCKDKEINAKEKRLFCLQCYWTE